MESTLVEHYRAELQSAYPGSQIKVAPDQQKSPANAPSRSSSGVHPYFHREITETYRVLRGTLLVARAGEGFVLKVGDSMTITPSQIHHAKALGDPAWIEVLCDPAWRADDHFVLT